MMTTAIAPRCLAPLRRRACRWAASLALVTLTLPMIGLGIRTAAEGASTNRGPIYSVAALDASLGRRPDAWLNRPLRVRALLGGACTAMTGLYAAQCSSWELALTDPKERDATPLPLAWGGAPPWLALWRRVPLLRQLAPAPRILYSGVTAVYRIELRTTVCAPMDGPVCYGALLLDARAPDNTTDWIRIP